MGEPGGGLKWKALVPCEGAVPLITALFSLLSFMLVMEMVVAVVMPMGVGRKLIVLWDSSKGDKMPRPSQAIL